MEKARKERPWNNSPSAICKELGASPPSVLRIINGFAAKFLQATFRSSKHFLK